MGDVRFIQNQFYLSFLYFEKQSTQFHDIVFLAPNTFFFLRCVQRNVKYELIQCLLVIYKSKHVSPEINSNIKNQTVS